MFNLECVIRGKKRNLMPFIDTLATVDIFHRKNKTLETYFRLRNDVTVCYDICAGVHDICTVSMYCSS